MTKRGSIQIRHQDKVNSFFLLTYFFTITSTSIAFFSHGIVEGGTTLPASEPRVTNFAAWSRVTYDSLTCVHACDNFKVEKRKLALQRVRRSLTCPALW